jgi:hypothetical protein
MYAATLSHKNSGEYLTVSASNIGDTDIQLGFEHVHQKFSLWIRVNPEDLEFGLGTAKTKMGTLLITNRRVEIRKDGLDVSWLMDDWELGEQTMFGVLNWLRSKVKELA